jgi:DNA-binding response OmpR family regulator
MDGRVLVVDDEEAIVSGLLYLLETEKIESSGVFDRLSAESLMEETFFSVVVADLRLHTDAEGLMLLDSIRRISPRSQVVTLTGFSTPEMEEEVLRRGAVMVIRKPAECAEILLAIGKLLAEVEKLAASEPAIDFEKLHGDLRRLMHSIPRNRYGLTHEDAEEVVQQAWLLFLENPGSWEPSRTCASTSSEERGAAGRPSSTTRRSPSSLPLPPARTSTSPFARPWRSWTISHAISAA